VTKQAASRSSALGPEYHFFCIKAWNSGNLQPSRVKLSPVQSPSNANGFPFDKIETPKHSSEAPFEAMQLAEYLSSKVTVDAKGHQY